MKYCTCTLKSLSSFKNIIKATTINHKCKKVNFNNCFLSSVKFTFTYLSRASSFELPDSVDRGNKFRRFWMRVSCRWCWTDKWAPTSIIMLMCMFIFGDEIRIRTHLLWGIRTRNPKVLPEKTHAHLNSRGSGSGWIFETCKTSVRDNGVDKHAGAPVKVHTSLKITNAVRLLLHSLHFLPPVSPRWCNG
jgi:hypothetical protein